MSEFTLEPEEEVLASVRKHPLIAIGAIIPFVFLGYLPTLVLQVVAAAAAHGGTFANLAALVSPENSWLSFIIGVYWLFVWMGAFTAFTDYYLDQFIVTNHRIIRIEQIGFWDREVSTLHMNRIQDVMTDMNGIFQNLFGYGTLSVESAAEDSSRFKMRGIRNARTLRDLIMREVTARQENITRISTSGTQ